MFGQTGNASFGSFNTATQSSPFGQSAFGKPIATTSFGGGATPVFGTGNASLFGSKPAGTTPGGLFGGTTTTAPAFGQPATTQSSFGGFGTTNTNGNLFGTQQNANTSLFGATNSSPAFGQANKPGSFGFGGTTGTSLFGQTQQPAQQTPSVFGQTNTAANTSLFGTTGFGGTNTAAGMTGSVVKFTPVTGSDTMIKNGVTQNISTRHHCITCMKEYESKSLEELRFEDYAAGRKGSAQGAPSTGLFGASTQSSPFGASTAGTSNATTGFGSMAGGFGATAQPATTSLFGKPMSGFGAPATTTSAFAFNPQITTNLFGAGNQAKPFGTAAPTPLFAPTNTAQTTGTGFGNINGTQPTTGFGTFGAAQPNQSIGLFGQNKSAFNMPASTVATGFGFGQTAPTNTGTGLFGAKPTGFGTTPSFATNAAPAFGTGTGFGTTQSTGTSLFNPTFKPAGQTTGFSFGNTPATSAGLGTNTGLNLGGATSLFGQPKPGGLFGNTGIGSTFNTGTFGSTTGFGTSTGTTQGLGMGMLGGGIGGGGGGGGIGGGGIAGGIGTSPARQNLGSMPVHQQILALVSAPFGDSPLLKNLLPASGKTEELLKPTNPSCGSLNGPQYKVATNNNSPKVKARAVTATQLSKKSLFEGLEEEDPTLLEAFQPRTNAKRLVLRPKPITESSPIQSKPTEDSVNSPRSVDGREEVADSSLRTANGEGGGGEAEAVANKENQRDNDRRSFNDRRSSSFWLKSTIPRKDVIRDNEFEGQRSPFRGSTDVHDESLNNTVAEFRLQWNDRNTPQRFDAASAVASNNSLGADKSATDLTEHSGADSSHEFDEASLSTSQIECEPNAARVTLRRAGYYTIPSLKELERFVIGETCVVQNFTVGRKGYGNVYFPDSFDVYGLNLDEIVHFRHKEVIIYPDDDEKPPVGQGLNRRAQVTLERVWPHDKTLHEPITDPDRLHALNYEEKLRRVSAKHDTRFLEYRPETGSWVFKVEHFSKYGLSDSDEEESETSRNVEAKKIKFADHGAGPRKTREMIAKPQRSVASVDGLASATRSISDETSNFRSDFLGDADEAASDLYASDYGREKQSAPSPTTVYARILGTDSHKLQLMKASFFDANDEEIEEVATFKDRRLSFRKSRMFESSIEPMEEEEDQTVPVGYVPILRSSLVAHQDFFPRTKELPRDVKEIDSKGTPRFAASSSPSPALVKAFPAPAVSPVSVVLEHPSEVVPLGRSKTSELNFRCAADASVLMGRTFRPGWGPGLTLLSLTTRKRAAIVPLQGTFHELGSYLSGRLPDDASSSIVQRLQIMGGGGGSSYVRTFEESVEGHLRIQLDHCIMGQEGDCPAVGAGANISALHAHRTLAQELAERPAPERDALYASDVWNLAVALWGNLSDLKPDTDDARHHNVIVRREALGDWLENVATATVQREVAEVESVDEKMLSLLSARKLEDACKLARNSGDYCLALLVAQLGGASSVKELTKRQLALWQDTEVDADMTTGRLKLYMLAAGEPLISSKQGTINACSGLDWKRALALHLWYVCPPTASITDALELYEAAFATTEDSDAYASDPRPEYKEEDYEAEVSSGKRIYDLCFHLLKLYCTGNHSLEELLNPSTHTADPLDYRLTWLVQQVLVALGYTHLSEHVAALTHVNFAAQLETYGLWHWAIFVVLHLRDTGRRRAAVVDLLSRHVELDEDPEYMRREEFLREELGIPSLWINRAKAVKGRATKRYGEAAWYLIQAEQWNAAHEIIMEYLAADAIVNENYEYLRALLSPLVPAECNGTVSGWAYQGQLLWDYMVITAEVETLLRGTDRSGIGYQLELLQPQLTLLCAKINQFPCPTAKHRLCQAEIAKRTSNLARSLLLLQSGEHKSTAKVLARLVSQLPLPEDYAQQEMRPIVNMCVNEIATR